MSLVNEYKQNIRSQLGLKEEDPTGIPINAGGGQPGMSRPQNTSPLDDETVGAVLELIQREIAKKEAVGEVEGMEDPEAKSVEVPEAPVSGMPDESMQEAEGVADDIYFEMLNSFKNNIANCEDSNRKNMYRKGYNYLYKMREKFIKEMTMCEEPQAAPATPK